MLSQAIGSMLPAAFAVALSPFPIVGIVLILSSKQASRNGPLFAAGWAAGLAIVAAIVVLVFGGADDAESTTSTIMNVLRIVAGAAFIALGVRSWRARQRSGDDAKSPKWIESLNDATAGRAFAIGALISGVNPKTAILTAAAATSIVESGVHGAELIVALLAFVLLGSCTVVGAVLIHFLGGERAAVFLESVREFMVANNAIIMAIVLIILGASILGNGISGLGS